jgi:hypothetical protein
VLILQVIDPQDLDTALERSRDLRLRGISNLIFTDPREVTSPKSDPPSPKSDSLIGNRSDVLHLSSSAAAQYRFTLLLKRALSVAAGSRDSPATPEPARSSKGPAASSRPQP